MSSDWKPGITLVSTMTEGDHIEVRLPLGVSRPGYVTWLMSDEAQASFAAWSDAHPEIARGLRR